jgi:hypothetical protein
MSCSDDNVYQGYTINLFGVVPVCSIGCIVEIAGLGAVAMTVQVCSQVEAISFKTSYIPRLIIFASKKEICQIINSLYATRF